MRAESIAQRGMGVLPPPVGAFQATAHQARVHSAGANDEGPQAPQHFLYFLPLPHGHGSLRPIFVTLLGATTVRVACWAASYASADVSTTIPGRVAEAEPAPAKV